MSLKRTGGLTVVVLAGAVARGPFEAGALSELLPQVLDDLSNTVFLGTSAGAINAVSWARFATPKRALREVGRDVEGLWRSIDYDEVLRPLSTTTLGDVVGLLRGFLTGQSATSLLDASPLRKTVQRELDSDAIAANLAGKGVRGVGVVATACGAKVASGRSHLFLQTAPQQPLRFQSSPDSSIDIYPAQLNVEHVLASSAVPVFFQPVRMQVENKWQYYIDGGVRLNTPIWPAVALGADRIIVVSSHTAHYARNESSPEQFGMADAFARVLHTVLADGMIEDLRRLREANHRVRQAREAKAAKQGKATRDVPTNRHGRELREIEYIDVSPTPGTLAELARSAVDSSQNGHRLNLNRLRYKFVQQVLGTFGAGPGQNELLSYVFFDPVFADLQFEFGRQCARDAAARDWQT